MNAYEKLQTMKDEHKDIAFEVEQKGGRLFVKATYKGISSLIAFYKDGFSDNSLSFVKAVESFLSKDEEYEKVEKLITQGINPPCHDFVYRDFLIGIILEQSICDYNKKLTYEAHL